MNYWTIEDVKSAAKKRVPKFVWFYLNGGTGLEKQFSLDRTEFDKVKFQTRICKNISDLSVSTTLFGKQYSVPFGIAPVGLSGFIWPGSEFIFARCSKRLNFPYILSTVATRTPEEIMPHTNNLWFQLYPPKDSSVLDSLLDRIRKCGVETLVVTADIPMPSRRESAKRSGFPIPPKYSLRLILQALIRPVWGFRLLFWGLPRLRTIERYSDKTTLKFVSGYVGNRLGGSLTWEYMEDIREKWEGNLIIKGIMSAEDAQRAIEIGVDGIIVSNHGARQFDANNSPLSVLKEISNKLGDQVPIIFDSGIREGLDIMKALSCGADFVLIGRPFMWGAIADNNRGVSGTYEILKDQLLNSMAQIGVSRIKNLKNKHI